MFKSNFNPDSMPINLFDSKDVRLTSTTESVRISLWLKSLDQAKVRCCLRHRWDVVLVAGILFEMWADPRGVAVVAAARVGMAVVVCAVPLPRLIRVVGAYDL